MDIILVSTGEQPIYRQIADQIKNQIMTGQLPPGSPLPSMRLLAKELRISVITTKRAYEELEREGFLVSITGKGSYVAEKNLEFIREESLRQIEEFFQKAIQSARQASLSRQELVDMLQVLMDDEPYDLP